MRKILFVLFLIILGVDIGAFTFLELTHYDKITAVFAGIAMLILSIGLIIELRKKARE